jgi:hypothetical protein
VATSVGVGYGKGINWIYIEGYWQIGMAGAMGANMGTDGKKRGCQSLPIGNVENKETDQGLY